MFAQINFQGQGGDWLFQVYWKMSTKLVFASAKIDVLNASMSVCVKQQFNMCLSVHLF